MNSNIKLNDIIKINPLQGRRKKVKILRTQIDFVSSNQFTSGGYRIDLPALDESFLFHLILEKDQFIFKSSNSSFFKYNGNWAREVLLKSGDQIYFSGNILSFEKEINQKKPKDNLKHIIDSSLPLLIEGETGTGKTYLAKEIHRKSNRRGRFVHLNLSAFSQNLVESELFGHVKGAFTGAIGEKLGAIKLSSYGTLFLDEIDSLSKELQLKLLLFFDNYTYRPVGSIKEEKCETRVIIASGQSLGQLVDSRQMRKDFYFRIASGFKLNLKALREKPDEIEKHCYDFCFKHDLSINFELLNFYKGYSWPGNLRQLYAHLEKKMITGGRCLSFDRYDKELMQSNIEIDSSDSNFKTLDEIKQLYVKKVYFSMNNDRNIAAKVLKIHPKTVEKLLH